MIDTVKRVRWKNILGLIVLVAVVFVALVAFSWISGIMNGDCVQKGDIKVCFSTTKSVQGGIEVTTIKTDVKNVGKLLTDASITMTPSPNLENRSAESYRTLTKLAPGDTIEWVFEVAPKETKGRFIVEFDINGDGNSDNEIYVEAK